MAKKTKTMIKSPSFGKFYFDAVFSTEHQASVTATNHPVQQGASISDHSYIEPDEVTIDIGMTDVMNDAGSDHSVNAYTTLRAIMEKREPVTLVTRLRTYQNMLITSMSAPDDQSTMNALRATIMFTHINIVSVSVVQVKQKTSGSKTPTGGSSGGKKTPTKKTGAKTGGKTGGTKTPQKTDGKKESILHKIFGK